MSAACARPSAVPRSRSSAPLSPAALPAEELLSLLRAHALAKALLLPPAQQLVPGFRIAVPGAFQRQHPVGPEMAEIITALAPGGDQAQVVEEGHGEGPDHAFAVAAFGIAVVHAYRVALADRDPQRRHPGLGFALAPVRGEQAAGLD